MPEFIVRRNSDNAEVFRYSFATQLTDWALYPPASHWQEEAVLPPDPPLRVYGGRRVLSKREFLRLLTQPERVAVRDYAKGNSPQAKAMDDYVFLLTLADTVNLDDQDVIDGLTGLTALGVLAAGRAEVIRNG